MYGGSLTGNFFKMMSDSYDTDKRFNREEYEEMLDMKEERAKKRIEKDEASYQEDKRKNELEHLQEEEDDEYSIIVDGSENVDDSVD
tara:strand:+ start:129 stop:389 length:261 start_codon:yes stop_codon:yes gene_type:complete